MATSLRPVDALAIARETILAPSGLDESQLDRVFGQVMSHSIDYADLYFQLAHEESWALEDSIVKEGSAAIEQGVGVRALSGEKTGFAYSDEIMLPALEDASRAARAIAAQGSGRSLAVWQARVGHQLYLPDDPLATLSDADKVAWLMRVDRETRALDPRVKQVMASVTAVHEVVLIANSDGDLAADVRPLVRFNVSVIVEQNGRREQGYSGCGGRYTLSDLVAEDRPLRLGQEAVRQALVNLDAVAAPAGPCTVVDDGTLPRRRGSLNIDDEGTPTGCTTLIENGILRGYMQDKLNARLMGGRSTGNGRRESFAHVTLPRMTNTYMRPGPHAPEDIISSVERGIYAVNFGGGQVDITSGKFVFSASEAYVIENGKLGAPLKGATLIGNGPDVLTRVSMVGNDMKLDDGIGTCGKDGQGVPVGVGQPTLRVDGLTVGGTG